MIDLKHLERVFGQKFSFSLQQIGEAAIRDQLPRKREEENAGRRTGGVERDGEKRKKEVEQNVGEEAAAIHRRLRSGVGLIQLFFSLSPTV